MLKDLILKNRSYRRFVESEKISMDDLRGLVDLARLSASSGNFQFLRFYLSSDLETNNKIFPNLAWAKHLSGWKGPAEGERPSAYIIILGVKSFEKFFSCDHGIVAQSMLLGAVEKGYGGCMIAAVNRKAVMKELNIFQDTYQLQLVVALGKPGETIVIDKATKNSDLKYWRDSNSVHHVPKLALDDLIIS